MNVNNNVEDLLFRSMPSASKLIRENNLDVKDIEGSGKDGRVTKGDVLLYLKDKNVSRKIKLNEEEKKISINRKDKTMDIIVPTLGESIVEATVSKWLRKEGDHVEIDEPIVELETDKVTLEVPASISGLIDKIVISEGETVEVGQVIGSLKEGDKNPKSNIKNDLETKKIPEKKHEEHLEVSKPGIDFPYIWLFNWNKICYDIMCQCAKYNAIKNRVTIS